MTGRYVAKKRMFHHGQTIWPGDVVEDFAEWPNARVIESLGWVLLSSSSDAEAASAPAPLAPSKASAADAPKAKRKVVKRKVSKVRTRALN